MTIYAFAELDGFTVHDGKATGTTSYEDLGGGILIVNADPTIEDCTITGNFSNDRGGGIAIINGDPLIAGCTIEGNDVYSVGATVSWGAGIYAYLGEPIISNCLIKDNGHTANVRGGGVALDTTLDRVAILEEITFEGNHSTNRDGGVDFFDIDPFLACLFGNCP